MAFDPSMFSLLARNMAGGLPSGGLLDFLRDPSQLAPMVPSAGFGGNNPPPTSAQPDAQPIAVGNYMMPRMGPASLYEPQPAALPPNAQPTQGQLPQAPAQPQQGFFDRLNSGLQSIGNGGSVIGALTGNYTDPANKYGNLTQRALVQRGFDPDLAKVVSSDPGLLRAVLPQLMGTAGQTDDIKEYQFAKREDPSLTFDKFMARKKSVSGEYGMQPIWGTGKDGKPAVLQLGKSGDAVQSRLPEGFQIARDPIKLDMGTHFAILDPQTRQVVGREEKNLRGAEREKEIGTAQGQAAAKLPAALVDADSTSKKIDELLATGSGLDSIVGALDQYRPSWTLGDSGRNALARLEQLQGGAFLQAFNTLKGGGAITEAEGRKAEQAIARMQRSQGEADFRIALQDFRDAVNDGIKKLRASAGETGAYPAAILNMQPAPAAGGSDLKKKYGLD